MGDEFDSPRFILSALPSLCDISHFPFTSLLLSPVFVTRITEFLSLAAFPLQSSYYICVIVADPIRFIDLPLLLLKRLSLC